MSVYIIECIETANVTYEVEAASEAEAHRIFADGMAREIGAETVDCEIASIVEMERPAPATDQEGRADG